MSANKLRRWVNAQATVIFKYNLFAQLPDSTSEQTFDVNLSQHNQICVNYLVYFGLNCCSESQDSVTLVLLQQRCFLFLLMGSRVQVTATMILMSRHCLTVVRFKRQI